MEIVRNDLIVDASYCYSSTVDVDIANIDQGSIQIDTVDLTGAAKVFVPADIDLDLDTVTIADHGLLNGQKVVTTTADTAPGGLDAGTYYIIVLDEDTIQFADSLAHALAGTALDLTTGAVDDQTITPSALASTTVTVAIQASNDGVTYTAYASDIITTTITGTSTELKDMTDKLNYRYLRVVITAAAGLLGLTVRLYGKRYR